VRLTLLRILAQQRALYDQPRDMNRFRAYIAQMTGGSGDVVLPIVGMNPMGKDKAKAAYDALLAMRAEDVAEQALREAETRLAGIEGQFQVALVVQDDAQGSWSQAEPNEAQHWQGDAYAKRGFAVAHFLSSQAPYAPEQVRRGVLAAVYRSAHIARHGVPRTLRDVLLQEGRTARFAGEEQGLGAPEVAEARARIAPHLDARNDWPETFAAMFGDEAAQRWGHKPLGVPARAGFAVAGADADEPVAALRG
jgi:hypothetical protein